MARLAVPAELQDLARRLALKSWVGHKHFPRDCWFETVDRCEGLLTTLGGANDNRHRGIALMLVGAIDHEGDLITWVIEQNTVSLHGDAQLWLTICLAAAWEIVAAHARAVNDGAWPRG